MNPPITDYSFTYNAQDSHFDLYKAFATAYQKIDAGLRHTGAWHVGEQTYQDLKFMHFLDNKEALGLGLPFIIHPDDDYPFRTVILRAEKATSKNTETPRGKVLTTANSLVNGDRNKQYGPPTQDFQRTADALNAYGYRGPDGRLLLAHDTAIIQMALKISRLMWTPGKEDTWVDVAGYAACGYECAVNKDE